LIKKLQNKHSLYGYIFALTATALWSGNFIIARDLSSTIPPVSIAFWRWAVAFIVITPFAAKSVIKDFHLLKNQVPYLILTSIFGITIFNTLIYIAGHTTTAFNLSLIALTVPIFILLLSRIFYKEHITLKKVIGIILVCFGVILIITKGSISLLLNLSFSIGDFWMLGASLIFAIYSLLLKRKPKEISIWSFQSTTFLLGLIFLLPFYIWERSSIPNVIFDTNSIISILYVGIFASLTAFVLWNKAILNIGATKSGMIYYTLPLFSGFLSHFFLKEDIGMVHLFSALLIISGILTANHEIKEKS
jgi:drug/metabolite transporter (DMT)-like permease